MGRALNPNPNSIKTLVDNAARVFLCLDPMKPKFPRYGVFTLFRCIGIPHTSKGSIWLLSSCSMPVYVDPSTRLRVTLRRARAFYKLERATRAGA